MVFWHKNVTEKWWGKPGTTDAEKTTQELQIKMATETLTAQDLAVEAADVAVGVNQIINGKTPEDRKFAGDIGENAMKAIFDKMIFNQQLESSKTTSPQPSGTGENIIIDVGPVE